MAGSWGRVPSLSGQEFGRGRCRISPAPLRYSAAFFIPSPQAGARPPSSPPPFPSVPLAPRFLLQPFGLCLYRCQLALVGETQASTFFPGEGVKRASEPRGGPPAGERGASAVLPHLQRRPRASRAGLGGGAPSSSSRPLLSAGTGWGHRTSVGSVGIRGGGRMCKSLDPSGALSRPHPERAP